MLPLRTAAQLLTDASSLHGLLALARTLGFTGRATPVEPADLDAGLSVDARLAVVPGRGTLRALLVSTAGEPARQAVARVARVLARRAPGPLWCVLGASGDPPETVVATWGGERLPPRVVALSVDRRRIVDSDADAVRALHAARSRSDVEMHTAWLDVLGRDALSRRFYRELEAVVALLAGAVATTARLDDAMRRELALLQLSRLVFLSFLEAKGWLDGDRAFLSRAAERGARGGLHRGLLRPLFFGTLNTPPEKRAPTARRFGRVPFLNGGLFAPTVLERRAADVTFPDDAVAAVFDRLLARYRFTAREDATSWSDAAVDPEMLGRAFEGLMQPAARRDGGAFYTPHALVAHTTAQALASALASPTLDAAVVAATIDGAAPPPAAADELRARALALRILDPACGSGAFLVHALETLADLARRAGDGRGPSALRRVLLASAIHGVDVNPMAVWLCELRLWLSVVIDDPVEDPLRVAPLPNLDRNVRVGDALAGGGFGDPCDSARPTDGAAALARLRARYVRATGPAKHAGARRLDAAERAAALRLLDERIAGVAERRRDLQGAARGRDLFGERPPPARRLAHRLAELRADSRRLRARRRQVADGAGLPFAFATHFADVAPSGFDLIVGNPPWVRPHRVPAAMRRALRRDFVVARRAAWERGARLAGAGSGFAGQADLAALFVERSVSLLRPGGTVALLLPGKLWRSLAGGGVRRLLAERCRLVALEDWTRAPAAFDAAVYPSLLVARRAHGTAAGTWACDAPVALAEHVGRARHAWSSPAPALALDASPGAPWVSLPPAARRAFDLVAARGVPLADLVGRPLLGVKCGCNEAFVHDADDAALRDVEAALLRPALRGDAVTPWRVGDVARRILWTHDERGVPLATLPPGARRHLLPWRHRLERRSDARGAGPWWSLHRTAAAACDRPRVVWADVARVPRAAVLPAGDPTVPLNSCYALRCATIADAFAVAALLAAPLVAAWLAALAEPARGGYARHLAWTMALLPLPVDWPRAREILAPIGERAWCGAAPADGELGDAVLDAYGVAAADAAPLLEWAAR